MVRTSVASSHENRDLTVKLDSSGVDKDNGLFEEFKVTQTEDPSGAWVAIITHVQVARVTGGFTCRNGDNVKLLIKLCGEHLDVG